MSDKEKDALSHRGMALRKVSEISQGKDEIAECVKSVHEVNK